MSRPTVTVVGSGFGGSVFACRLAQSGRFDVRVLERGRQFQPGEFPRRPAELRDNIWDPRSGHTGMFEYRTFDKSSIDVVTAAGVGGGSLIYSNILFPMSAELFHGWPGGIDRQLLEPHYQQVLQMMEARPYPMDEPTWSYAATPKSVAYARAAASLTQSAPGQPAARYEHPPLAVQFGPEAGASIVNRHGVRQAACNRCGECNVGCNVGAKNTLDRNYLHVASQRHGATIEPFHEVRSITPLAAGRYALGWVDPRYPFRSQTPIESDYVILAAGALGSSRLLLRCQRAGYLSQLDASLGTGFSPNGDVLGFVYDLPDEIPWDCGPTITSSIRFWNGSYPDGMPQELFVQNCGFPNFLFWYLGALIPSLKSRAQALTGLANFLRGLVGRRNRINVIKDLTRLAIGEQPKLLRTFALLGMGRDRSTGTMSLRGQDGDFPAELHIKWDARDSALHYDRMREAMTRIAEALGGRFMDLPSSALGRYITVHPVGGCPLADPALAEAELPHPRRPERPGVVNARTGEIFGHPGLYVVDGSILPTAAGPNPSLTIAALAELFAQRFCERESPGQ